jgi:hypothetical protein
MQTLKLPPTICGDELVIRRNVEPNDLKRDIIYQVLESTLKMITFYKLRYISFEDYKRCFVAGFFVRRKINSVPQALV